MKEWMEVLGLRIRQAFASFRDSMVALFDEQGRLLGVASGGSRVNALKPSRQRTFKLVFDDVNREAYKAKTFQISIESKG